MVNNDAHPDYPLAGYTIAVPESREASTFAGLIERQGASVVRCPLIAISDNPDQKSVERWLEHLIAGDFDDVIFFTGEGVRRLLASAERMDQRQRAIEALRSVRKLTRGPKPIRALRQVGLATQGKACPPTTPGIIQLLNRLDLRGHHVGVQLYGQTSNPALSEALCATGAIEHTVWPYVYASKAADEKVAALIEHLAAGQIDLIAFTSSAQVDRLFAVASQRGCVQTLETALRRTAVAALGPVVAEALRQVNVKPRIQLTRQFAMKPMVRHIVAALSHDRS